ncbi:fungal-specific transcription factor domain-containing protein, partial [Mycena amicta]
MSDDEDDGVKTRNRAVHRREQRACDTCRRRRSACNGSRVPAMPCTLCVDIGVQCRFTGLVAKRRTYVEALEDRVKEAEQKVEQMVPSTSSASIDNGGESMASPSSSASANRNAGPGPGVELAALSIRSMNVPAPTADVEYLALMQGLAVLSLSNHRDHFHGEGSGAMVVKSAVELRERYMQMNMVSTSRREKYWAFTPRTAMNSMKHLGPYIFPPPDLLASLIDLYFLHKNPFLPLLHRPTFDAAVAESLHTRDQTFGGIVLLVCGIGARFSTDSRVTPLGMDELLCGYAFFHQVTLGMEHMFGRPTLHHIQLYCLFVIFCEYSNHSSCWTIVGTALRMAQDVGAHRRPRTPSPPTVESELWNRAFWVCVWLDRQLSSGHGRPSMIPWEDFDANLPLEVDDEYWEDPVHPFVQPANKGPSTIAYFNAQIRLSVILGFALSMLYALEKARRRLAFRDALWEERIVAELDSALNQWVDGLPAHLRWDPVKQSRPVSALTTRAELFLDQSVMLYGFYYFIQITVHRPFIPALRTGQPTTLPSLAICTNAARSYGHVLKKLQDRRTNGSGTPFPELLVPSFMASIMLVLNVWSGKRTGLPPHMNSAMEQVRRCMGYLESCDKRWQRAGLFWEILFELCSIGELPVEHSAPISGSTSTATSRVQDPNSKKRFRPSTWDTSPGATTSAATVHTPFSFSAQYHASAYLSPSEPQESSTGAWRSSGAHLRCDGPEHSHPDSAGDGDGDGKHSHSHSQSSSGSDPNSDPASLHLQTRAQDLAQMPVFLQASANADADGNDTSTHSTWYPAQTSDAPFGFPDFAVDRRDETMYGVDARDLAAMEMWASAPTSFEMNDWQTYFSAMSELQHGQPGVR